MVSAQLKKILVISISTLSALGLVAAVPFTAIAQEEAETQMGVDGSQLNVGSEEGTGQVVPPPATTEGMESDMDTDMVESDMAEDDMMESDMDTDMMESDMDTNMMESDMDTDMMESDMDMDSSSPAPMANPTVTTPAAPASNSPRALW